MLGRAFMSVFPAFLLWTAIVSMAARRADS
jgi:hypothetical protein